MREFGQDCFQREAYVDVYVRDIDEVLINHTKLHCDVLEDWWMKLLQELGDVLNGGFAPKLDHYDECVQLLPSRHLREE